MKKRYLKLATAVQLISLTALLMMPDISFLHANDNTIYSGDPKTIAHDFLDLEKDLGAGKKEYDVVDKLINRAIIRINIKKSYTTGEAVEIMRTIDSILKEEGFVFNNNLLLSIGLRRKVLDCDNYCALYIAIAEVLGIPILPVYAPNHTFLRFGFDDATYIDWETTQGKVQSDSYYRETLRMPEESVQRGVYLKNLSRREFTAVEYNTIGAYLISMRKFAEAVPYFSAAIKIYPLFSSAYHNRGTACYAIKRFDEALGDLLKANELDPSRASTHNTLGDIYFDRKEYDKAVNEFTESIRLDPMNYVPYSSIGLIMKIQKKDDEAQKWFDKSREIKSKH